MNIDQRKKYFMVFDTETTSAYGTHPLSMPLIYDLAWSICDKDGHIYEDANYVIKDIYQEDFMVSAYYANKIPKYEQMLIDGEAIFETWENAIYYMNEALARYNNITICAYNLSFDLRALSATSKFTRHPLYKDNYTDIFEKNLPIQDIWSLYVETVMSIQKRYAKFIEKHNLYTNAGNPLSNPEVGYRYLTNDSTFIEDHTALSDTRIEVALLSHGISQHKAYTKGIRGNPWSLLRHMKVI